MKALCLLMLALPTLASAQAFGSKEAAYKAAQGCGTTVKLTDFPKALADQLPEQAAKFSVELNPRATPEQQRCFNAKIPMTRIGFITSPNSPKKKN